MTPELDLGRARSLTELLDATFAVWWRHRSAFFTSAVVLVAPVAIISQGITRSLPPTEDMTADDLQSLMIVGLLSALQYPLITGAYMRAVERLGAGEGLSVGEVLLDGLRRFGAVFVAVLLAGLATIGGFILLVIPGIYLMVRLAFAGQAAAVDRAGPVAAFRESMRITRGCWWRVAGILLLVVLASVVLSAAAAPFAAVGGAVELAAVALVQTLVTSLSTLAQSLFFYDLRSRADRVEPAAATSDPAADAW